MQRTEERLTAEKADRALRAAEKVLGKLEQRIKKDPKADDLKKYYLLGTESICLWRKYSSLRPVVFYDRDPEALLEETAKKVPELRGTVSVSFLFPLEYSVAWADTRRFLSEMTQIVSASTDFLMALGTSLLSVLDRARLASGDGLRGRLGKGVTEEGVRSVRDMLLQTCREELDGSVSGYAKLLEEGKRKDFANALWMYLQMLAYCESYTACMELYDEWLGIPIYSLTDSLSTRAYFDMLDSRRQMSAKLKEETIPELTGLLSLPEGYWDPIAPLLDRAERFPTSCEVTEAGRTILRRKIKDMTGDELQVVIRDVSSPIARSLAIEAGIK